MEGDEIKLMLGKLQGTLEANHTETRGDIADLRKQVEELRNLHQRLKGAMAIISLLAAGGTHAFIDTVKKRLGGE